ncbi:MAG: DUF4091 domain-containing protein [bacterium]|nr:DUF4091 domain-containing protein [bacterium]
MSIGKTNHPPNLDGKLDDWKDAVSVSGFTLNDGKGYASQQTRVYLTYDKNSLYIAYRCYEDDIANLRISETRHDGLPWRDDSIELLILADNNWDKLAHIVVNAGGALYDAIGMDPENSEWESNAQVAVGKDEKSWTVELAIPFENLGGRVSDSPLPSPWKINFYRNRYREKAEYSSWSYCPGPFKNPTRLGKLLFKDSIPLITLPSRLDCNWGYNELEYQFMNQKKEGNIYQLQLDTLSKTGINRVIAKSLSRGRNQVSFLLSGIEDAVQVSVVGKNQELLYRQVYPLLVKPESVAGELAFRIGYFQQFANNPNVPTIVLTDIETAVNNAEQILNEFKEKATEAYCHQQQIPASVWAKLAPELQEAYKKLIASQTIVWKKGVWENLFPDEMPPTTEEVKEINLLAMQDEYISAALNITNLSFLPYSARVWLEEIDGKTDDGKSAGFPRENIIFRRVVFRQLKNGITAGDALPEMDQAHLVEVPTLQSGQIWISIKTHNVPAGEYSGRIILKPLEDRMFSQKTVRLNIKVLPIALPKEMPIATYLWDYAKNDVYVRDLIDHKINKLLVSCYLCPPVCDSTGNVISIDFTKHDEAVAMKHKYGNEIMFSYGVVREFDRWAAKKNNWEYMSEPWKKAFATWLKLWVNHLLELGLDYSDFSMQIWDEATGEPAKKVAEVGPFLRSIDPKIRWVMNGAQDLEEAKQMNPYVDIWIPHLDSLMKSSEKEKLVAFYKSTGKPIWSYTCRVNMTSQPVLDYYRLKPWYVYQLGFDGVCFWAYDSWRGDPWSDFDAVGEEGYYSDNGVVYSGDQGPIPSRRWEAYREGLQDYQYLYMLEQLVKQAEEESTVQADMELKKLADEGRSVLNQAVAEVLKKKDEPTVYFWREKIAEMILELRNRS